MDAEGALVLGMLGIIFVPILIAAIIVIVANFIIYKKAGEDGWKCLIPYYNTWTECKFLGLNTNWVWIILASTAISGALEDFALVGLITSCITLYFNILKSVSLAQSFGKDPGYAVGLILLPFIFSPILAFGKSEYIGQRPMKDFVFKGDNTSQAPVESNPQQYAQPQQSEENQILNATPQVAQTKFCTNCGAQVEAGTSFCTSCGTQVQ